MQAGPDPATLCVGPAGAGSVRNQVSRERAGPGRCVSGVIREGGRAERDAEGLGGGEEGQDALLPGLLARGVTRAC